MKAFVFTDEALASDAGRFVWLEINTEQPVNASFRTQYNVQALPTYFIVDPRDETILARRVGGATVPQLKEFLNGGALAYAGEGLTPADLAVARAESLYAADDAAGAAKAYREALDAATPDWTGYAQTVEALLFTLQMTGDSGGAAKLAAAEYPNLRMTAAAANLAASGLGSALELEEADPDRERLVAELLAASKEVAESRAIPVPDDDRSSVIATLASAYETLGDSTAARATYQRWADFLDEAAARAGTPEERTVFDSHRMSAYMEVGKPEGAIPFLEQSERDFPDDYNPPARLAVIHLTMKDFDKALAANDRALARVYGPRTLRVLNNRVDIFDAKGDTTAVRMTLEEALAFAESLPEGQRSERTIDGLKKRLGRAGK